MSREPHLLSAWQSALGDRAVTVRELLTAAEDHEELQCALEAAIDGSLLSAHRVGRLLSDTWPGDGTYSARDRYGNANRVTSHKVLTLVHAGREGRSKAYRWRCVTYESLRPKPPPATTPGNNCGALLRGPRDSINDSRAWRHHPTLLQVRDRLANAGLPALLCDAGIALPGIALEDSRLDDYREPYGAELVEFAPPPGSTRGDWIAAPDLSLLSPGASREVCGSERAALARALQGPAPKRAADDSSFITREWSKW